jgi:dephospho-CoA kinase
MLDLFKVAVTGSIASGKSTVCQFFKQWGAYVVDADKLLHNVFSVDSPLGKRIISLLGEKIVINSCIDRAEIARIVFSHPELLEQLEDICHPYVNETIKELYNQACCQQRRYIFFVAEIPLLYESRYPISDWFNMKIAVISDTEIAAKRYQKGAKSLEQFLARKKKQLSSEDQKKFSDYIITNNGSIEELKLKSKEFFKAILQSSQNKS